MTNAHHIDHLTALSRARFADTIEEAEVLLDIVREQTGRAYKAIPYTGHQNAFRNLRWFIRWMPQVGDGVIHSIGGDTYYVGEVTKVTKTTFTAGGTVYRWSAKRQCYNETGCSYVYARPGVPEDARLDPHF